MKKGVAEYSKIAMMESGYHQRLAMLHTGEQHQTTPTHFCYVELVFSIYCIVLCVCVLFFLQKSQRSITYFL